VEREYCVRVIGVIDVLNGRAVHARGGRRESYGLVREVAGSRIEPGDALALARTYVERFDLSELYVADLDAIAGGAPGATLIAAMAAPGATVWLDAGITTVDRARRVLALGAARVVVGLETLSSWEALEQIASAVGDSAVAFSLDLRNGAPVGAPGDAAPSAAAHEIAARAADAGVGSVLVLDLVRVGTGRGLDIPLIARVREAVPGLLLLAGGGVRGSEDLRRLADAGCDGALVATALHDGRLSAADVATAGRFPGNA
jgi:phosphoribosylformimino-5-aminoimidazole carboxamide ribotide isomerase